MPSKEMGLSGRPAMWLSAIIAALLAVIALSMTHQLAIADLTLDRVFAAFGQVLAAATLAYKLLTE